MSDPTNTQRPERPERPEWAQRILEALDEASRVGRDGRLTEAERDLLFAIDMRLRDRLGEPGPDGPTGIDLATLAAFVLERATKAISAGQRKPS